MTAPTKTTYIKPSNLNLINNGLEGSKMFAYRKLIETKGQPVTGSKKYNGFKLLYIGGQNYIGGKFTTYSNGSIKADLMTAQIEP